MSAVLNSIKSFQDGAFADLIVRCGNARTGRTFKLHRVIVCPQSTTFDEMCRGAENLDAPCTNYTLPKQHDPDIFEKLVQFWYTGNYQDEDHYPPLIDVPELAWQMSPDELQAALEPSGERVGTHDLIFGDYNAKDVQDDDSEDDSEEDEEDDEGDDEEDGEEEDEDEEEEHEDEEEEHEDEEEEEDDDESDTVNGEIDDVEMVDAEELANLQSEPEGVMDYLDGTPTALKTSLYVFTMAHHFGVPALKVVAKERFFRCVERNLVTNFSSPEFLDCVSALYKLPDQEGSLAPLKEIMVACIHTIIHSPDANAIMPTVAKHAELSVELLKYNVKAQRRPDGDWLT
ncbi:hypothetical protein V8F20_010654 [Naviculisporaceae sp. PSN 640]